MTNAKLHTVWVSLYAVLLVIGALLTVADNPIGFYPFAVGALLAVAQTFTFALQNKSQDIRISRLHRINFLTATVLIIAACLMWFENNGWVVMVFLYCILTLYISFRMPK